RRPTTRCSVRLKVGTLDKTVYVWGDRRLASGLLGIAMTKPEPFGKMPLTWERTYGGWDRVETKQAWEASNPAGRGFAIKPSHLDDTMAPNVEYPGSPYRGPNSGRAAAFGPVAHHWQPRVRYGGTYDTRWQETRNPLPPVDFDRRYYRCAPEDQQTKTPLVGHEEVTLTGFTPE